MLISDEPGDRKDGTQTAHVAHQYLGSVGRIANGIVSVTSLWAAEDGRLPAARRALHPGEAARPRGRTTRPAAPSRNARSRSVDAAIEAGFTFRAVVADCLYGEHPAVQTARWDGAIPEVMGLRAQRAGTRWVVGAGRRPAHPGGRRPGRALGQPAPPGGWTAVVRRCRDGHREPWWAADLRLAGMAPEQTLRLVAVTTDPARLPADSTWYLLTNLPHPDAPHAATSPVTPGRSRRGRAAATACGCGWSRATSK